jgi:hypothetical protein
VGSSGITGMCASRIERLESPNGHCFEYERIPSGSRRWNVVSASGASPHPSVEPFLLEQEQNPVSDDSALVV